MTTYTLKRTIQHAEIIKVEADSPDGAHNIPPGLVQDLLDRADIVEVVNQHVALEKAGGGCYKGLCPFHNEMVPSFTVCPSKKMYHCFGCGAHGTAIGFLMERAGMGFVDAVKDLAGRYGMSAASH